MTVAALITAGGTGTRMGSSVPKQYLDLCGLPVLAHTLRVFQDHPLIDRIVLTVPPGDEDFCRTRIVVPNGTGKLAAIVAGGRTRQESVFNGLMELVETDVVAIHDGVRPLVSEDIITKTIEMARVGGAAIACQAVRDTVKRQEGPHLETVPRSDLWLAHTPQTFQTSLIVRGHRAAREEGFEATDDSMLVERLGHPITVVEDTDDNLKITTPADLARAAMLIELRYKKHRCK